MDQIKKVLVVDDSRLAREALRIVLEGAGYEVIFSEDGVSAIEKSASERPDLVITDGLLPKMHGFLVCKAIKELDPPPKVLLLTGIYTKPTYKWQVKSEYRADEMLTKPFNTVDLLACVRRLVGPVAKPDQSSSHPNIDAGADDEVPRVSDCNTLDYADQLDSLSDTELEDLLQTIAPAR